MPTTKLEPLLSHKVFRWASGANALVALLLGILGSLLGNNPGLRAPHAGLAILLLLTALTATLSGMRYGKESHTKGLTVHGAAVLVAALVQYGLGETGQTMLHMGLGVLIILGAGWLFARSLQQPAIVTGQRVAHGPATDAPPTGDRVVPGDEPGSSL